MDQEQYSDRLPLRVKIPLISGLVVVVGIIIYAILKSQSESYYQNENIIDSSITKVIMVSLLFVFLAVKSYFGPAITGISTSILIFNAVENEVFDLHSWAMEILSWAFGVIPDWIGYVYLIFVGVYILSFSIKDSFDSLF